MNARKAFAFAGLLALNACDDSLSCTDQECTPLVIGITAPLDTLSDDTTIELVADGEQFTINCPFPEEENRTYACGTLGGIQGEQYTVWVDLWRDGEGEAFFSIRASNFGSSQTIGPSQLDLSLQGPDAELFSEAITPKYEDQGEVWGPGCGTCSTASLSRTID